MAKSTAPCLVCNTSAKHTPVTLGDFVEIDCPACGQYQASNTYREIASRLSKEIRRRSLERARMRARYGLLPQITTYDLP